MTRKKSRAVIVLAMLMVVYVGSYYGLSRRGFRQADTLAFEGFYFVGPGGQLEWTMNVALNVVYWPLIQIDVILGTGRFPGSDPTEQLSAMDSES